MNDFSEQGDQPVSILNKLQYSSIQRYYQNSALITQDMVECWTALEISQLSSGNMNGTANATLLSGILDGGFGNLKWWLDATVRIRETIIDATFINQLVLCTLRKLSIPTWYLQTTT